MNDGGLQVELNRKFSVLALPGSRGGGAPQQIITLPGDNFVTSILPTQALATWKDSVGRFHIDQLSRTSLFLWSTKLSATPDVLDQENEELRRLVWNLYLGMLIAVPYISHERVTYLTGGNADGTPMVRSLTTYPSALWTEGTPKPSLSFAKVQLAGRLAAALGQHDSSPDHRIVRAVRAFREALNASEVDIRLHQFVRCAEAFVISSTGAVFADRVARICGGVRRPCLKELYHIRSGIEHLHGPFDRLPAYLSHRSKHIRLLQRCMQAEVVARFLLRTYFATPQLWPHFGTRRDIAKFWKLPTRQFNKLWPRKLALRSVLRQFDMARVRRVLGR